MYRIAKHALLDINVLKVKRFNVMDVNNRNILFSKGEIDRDDLWPKITEYRDQPCTFRMCRSPATCTIEVPDIRKAFEELKAKGVQFETEVLEFPWGWVAVFLDLNGNRLLVRHGR